MAHAWFAASASSRWLQCGASAVIDTSRLPREYKPAADRGTALHAISETLLRGGHDDLPEGLHPPDGEAVMEYVNYVRSLPGEKWYELSSMFIDQCGGTSDCVAVYEEDGAWYLHTVDAKFGSWMVDPRENTQMIIYALGCLRDLGVLYDFDAIRMTIAQPACGDPRTWELDVAEAVRWGRMIAERVNAVMEGDAEFNPSPEACKWCPGRTLCPAKAAFGKASAKLQFAVDYEDPEPEHYEEGVAIMALLDMDPGDWTWAQKMRVAEMAELWSKTIKATVRQLVLDDPKAVPGFKAVEGQRKQEWDGDDGRKAAKEFLEREGKTEQEIYTDPVFVSPNKAKGLFTGKGSGVKKKKLDEFITRQPGAPTVVPESDSRPAIDKKAIARAQFADDPEE